MKYIILILFMAISISPPVSAVPHNVPTIPVYDVKVNTTLQLWVLDNRGTITIAPGGDYYFSTIQLGNDFKTKRGALVINFGAYDVMFHLGQKIELDSNRLPYWLTHLSAWPNQTGQYYGITFDIIASTPEKNGVRHETWPCRQVITVIQNGNETKYEYTGQQSIRYKLSKRIDTYEARLFLENKILASFKFQVNKDAQTIISKGACYVPDGPLNERPPEEDI